MYIFGRKIKHRKIKKVFFLYRKQISVGLYLQLMHWRLKTRCYKTRDHHRGWKTQDQ